MKLIHKTKQWLLIPACIVGMSSCKKFLDEKAKPQSAVPTTLADLQSLLDNSNLMNLQSTGVFSELIADNFYVTTATWQSFAAQSGNPRVQADVQNHIWSDPGLPSLQFWSQPYQFPIYFANIVLDQLPNIPTKAGEADQYNAVEGAALFYRAFAFHVVAQLFCAPYSQQQANDPGIVLRATSDISTGSTRATVQQTYDRIITDLKRAADLLPITVAFPTRPSRTAAYAALARAYLTMRDYTNAGKYADMALQQKSVLLDYNTLNPNAAIIIAKFNPEVIFHSMSNGSFIAIAGNAIMDSTLYQSYNTNDLRKTVFFGDYGTNPKTWYFQGGYDGSNYEVFDGLATDELYLTRAECSARAGNKDSAMADLNRLLVKRWKNTIPYVAVTASDANDALAKVLVERRKELVWRGLRWSDIRRLNLEGNNITLTRIIGGTTYTLPPNDKRSVMLIPYEEITRSGIEQNPR